MPASALTLGLLICHSVGVRSARGASFNRLAMAGEPAAPSKCSVSLGIGPLGAGEAVVQWDDNSDNEDGFTVEMWTKATANEQWVLQQARDVPANITQTAFINFIDSSLAPINQFRVRAFNASGVSAWSKWAKFYYR
jgi:hypothetical protein